MDVCCECYVLSGIGLCDELISRQEDSYRLCCVVVCDLENLKNEDAMTRVVSQRHKKNETLFPSWQNESWQTFEETSGYMRLEGVNKWTNSMTDI